MTSTSTDTRLAFSGTAVGGLSSRVGPATQFVRVAATMTGGVSLAVWMGGVAREIDLLCQASTWRGQLPAGDDVLSMVRAPPEADPVLPLYLQLLDVLDVAVDTDVLSGTSAGGINSALLGYARTCNKDLGGLRDLWTTVGSLGTLLRDPRDPAVPSLMYGDRQLWAGVSKALQDMPDMLNLAPTTGVKPPFDAPETHLFITTTLLNGETSRFTDSYGTIVQDVEHHGLFTFSGGDFIGKDRDAAVAALALAARSSASFPAAFEPAFVPYSDAVGATAALPLRPAMRRFANITRAHWVADGGLLANRPIRPILQAIFDRPATVGAVRRVLLYIVPSAGEAPDMLRAQPGDVLDSPLGLVQGLLKDLSAVAAQSITSDLQTITDHNDRVRARGDARLQLAEIAARLPDPSSILTPESLTDYAARAGANASGPVVDAFMRRITTWPVEQASPPPAGSSDVIPTVWADYLGVQPDAEVRCRQEAARGLSQLWGATLPTSWAELASFGRPAFDGAKAILLALVRDSYLLADQPDTRTLVATMLVDIHAALSAPAPTNVQSFVDEACTRAALRTQAPPQVVSQLSREWLQARVTSDPGRDPSDLLVEGWKSLVSVLNEATIGAIARLARDDAPSTGSEPATGSEPPPESPPEAIPGSYNDRRRGAASHVLTYLTYLTGAPQTAGKDTAARQSTSAESTPEQDQQQGDATSGTDPDQIDAELRMALRLFSLHAAQRAMLPVSAELDQPVEFIQVSADTRTLLDPCHSTAASKLTGMQVHNFGAFYKASWRVNDWMWGRLDGTGWLVHMLLDPSRVHYIAHALDGQGGTPRQRFLNLLSNADLAGPFPADGFSLRSTNSATTQNGKARVLLEQDILDELSYLDDPTVHTPLSLPLTSLWVASAWQQRIVETELPVLADTILNGPPAAVVKAISRARGDAASVASLASPTAAPLAKRGIPSPKGSPNTKTDEAANVKPSSVQWATTVNRLHRADVTQAFEMAAYLSSCPVPNETFATEVGSSLLTRTVTHAAATTIAAVNSVQQLPSGLRPVLASMRTVSLTGYRATTLVDPRPRLLAALGLGALVLGLAAAIQQTAWLGLSGTLLALIGAYLLALASWGASRMLVGALLSILLVAGIGSLALPWVRRWLFGTGETDGGLIGRNVYWVGASWWHPFLAIGLPLLALALVSVVFDPAVRRSKPGTPSRRQDT